jgi:hypothetical protein
MLMESKTLQQSTSYTVGYCREYKMNNAFLVKTEKYLDANKFCISQVSMIHTPMDTRL